jgi:hypothetical protein
MDIRPVGPAMKVADVAAAAGRNQVPLGIAYMVESPRFIPLAAVPSHSRRPASPSS